MGLLLAVAVHAADIQDRDGARLVIAKLAGTVSPFAAALGRRRLRWEAGRVGDGAGRVEAVKRPRSQHTYQVLPRRWVVERTLAWLGRCRRLSKDYEALPETTGSWVYIAMAHLMLRRLAPA